MRTPDEEVEAVELLLCLVPVPPAPTAELDDCIVLTPANADTRRKHTSICNQLVACGEEVLLLGKERGKTTTVKATPQRGTKGTEDEDHDQSHP